jgi:MFS superfamily sulfate permease-like transporter
LQRLLPGLAVLRGYRRLWLQGDLLAGLTVAAYLVPQVMAYADLAGLPPVAGLWAILAPLTLYVLLGSSRHLSVGPESTTALMTAAVVAPLAAGDPARYAALAVGLAVVVGLLCLVAFAARLGFVADLLSKPILVGYLAGVAVTMIVGQLGKLTGAPVDGDSIVAEVVSFVAHLPQLDPGTTLFAAAVLALLFLGQWRFPRLPTPLLVVLLATAAVVVFDPRAARHRRGRCGSARPTYPGAAGRWRPRAAAAAGGRRARRGLHRHGADRPVVRGPRRLPGGRQPGVPGPGRSQLGGRRAPRVPDQQQR